MFKYIQPLIQDKRVLDLGCGAGRYLNHFSSESIGLDVSTESIQIAKNRGLNVIFADLNYKLDFKDEFFDVIFCSHVLEHVDSPINLLRECNRVLKESGQLFVAVPHEINIPNLIKLDDYFGNHSGHIYSFTINNMQVQLLKTGFEVQNIFVDLYLMKKLINKFPKFGGFVLDIAQKMPLITTLPFSSSYLVSAKRIHAL